MTCCTASPARTALVALVALVATASGPTGCSSEDPRGDAGIGSSTTSTGVASPTTASPAAPSRREATLVDWSRWSVPSLSWSECPEGRALECAVLPVPRDWAELDGPIVELAVGRARARRGDARVGTLLTNPGGPGASGLEYIAADPFGPALTDRFDVVSWDPRGVGRSTPLRCAGASVEAFLADDPSPDSPQEWEAIERDAAAIARDCETSGGALLDHIGTDQTVNDIEAIRLALGGTTISYVGFSYGTAVGLRYAERYPASLRAWVLDGVVDPTQDLRAFLVDQSSAFDAALRSAMAACDDTPECPIPDPTDALTELDQLVERAPLRASDGDEVGPASTAAGLIEGAYERSGRPQLWKAVADGLRGDGTGLGALADSYFDKTGFTAYLATVCADSPHPVGADAYRSLFHAAEAASPLTGPGIANELLPCAFWEAPTTGSIEPVRAPGAPTALVLGNTGDPATPVANARHVAETLERARLVVLEGASHGSYGESECVDRAVEQYLLERTEPAGDVTCR